MNHLLGCLVFLALVAMSVSAVTFPRRKIKASNITMALFVNSMSDENRLMNLLPEGSIDFSFRLAANPNQYIFLVNNTYGAVWTYFPRNSEVETFVAAYQSDSNATLAPPRAQPPAVSMADLTDEDLYLIDWTFILNPGVDALYVVERYSALMEAIFPNNKLLQGFLYLGTFPHRVSFFGNIKETALLDTIHRGVQAMLGPGNALVKVTPIVKI